MDPAIDLFHIVDVSCDNHGCKRRAVFVSRSAERCERFARAHGWMIDHVLQVQLCPKCAPSAILIKGNI